MGGREYSFIQKYLPYKVWGANVRREGRGQGLNESTFMLLCYDMNSERVILALNVYIMSGELLH